MLKRQKASAYSARQKACFFVVSSSVDEKNPGTAPFRVGVKCSGIFCVNLLNSGDAYSMTKTVVVTRLRFVSTLAKFQTLAKLFAAQLQPFATFSILILNHCYEIHNFGLKPSLPKVENVHRSIINAL
ncbi:hypothetical protein DQ356_10925 [Chryseobacterium lacus]|uniref:Uncharacterized protein n=1 Tax=Chryseobacterium lacus TaxID=2058346 RepID=A0A368MXX3_9FLAO|nr:hypothetical protein DQ356_10925 [Chryseobacterium lacus]